MDLNQIWFILIGVLLTGYIILDGFDLGVGILTLFIKDPSERKLYIRSIWPFWDGNEVWLVTAIGALFGAFPIVYTTIMSTFYVFIMLLIASLILRAIAIEFTIKAKDDLVRHLWSRIFGLCSVAIVMILGFMIGNILGGINMGANGYEGTLLDLLNPFAGFVSILAIFVILQHGILYIRMRISDDKRAHLEPFVKMTWFATVIILVVANLTCYFNDLHLSPIIYLILLGLLLVAVCGVKAMLPKPKMAFFFSSMFLLLLMACFGSVVYPSLVVSTQIGYHLTIYNSSSQALTLRLMFYAACIGLPLMLAYTVFMYRTLHRDSILQEDYKE